MIPFVGKKKKRNKKTESDDKDEKNEDSTQSKDQKKVSVVITYEIELFVVFYITDYFRFI